MKKIVQSFWCLFVFVLCATSLPTGLQKYLSGNKYLLAVGPKEFVTTYDKSEAVGLGHSSENADNPDYIVYGKLFVLKKNPRFDERKTNSVVPNFSDKQYRLRYPNYHQKEEAFSADAIFFPNNPNEESRFNKEYKRYVYENTDEKESEGSSLATTAISLQTPQLAIIPYSSKSEHSQSADESAGGGETALNNDSKDSTTTTTEDLQTDENDNDEIPLGAVSMQDLKKWADAHLPSAEPSTPSTTDTDLSFQSLFIVPGLKNTSGCPGEQRKNHAGVCVTPYTHKPSPPRKAIDSTFNTLMQSLRSVEIQALNALLGTGVATTESIRSGAVEMRHRHNFAKSRRHPPVLRTTPRPNHFRSFTLPSPSQPKDEDSGTNTDSTTTTSTVAANEPEKSILEILQEFGRINLELPM